MKKGNKVSFFVFIFLIITVFYPILMMLLNVEWSNFSLLVSSSNFKEALTNSVLVTSVSTIISILIAYTLAYTLNRTNIKHRALLKVLITVPMLIPSVSHGLGLINLFGANGIISRCLNFDIIGFSGIVLGSLIYSFPVAFLIINDGFSYIDNSMYQCAKVLGLNKWQTFKTVTLTYLKKPIISSIFATFTLIFTDYGVPLAVGGKFITLPVFLYKEVIGLLDFSTGTMVGLFLLVPAFISFIFDTFTKDYSSGDFEGKIFYPEPNDKRDKFFTAFTHLIILFIMLVIGSFVYYAVIDNVVLNPVLSTVHFEYVFKNKIFKYIFNSLFIAIMVSLFGTIISYLAAYSTARIKAKESRIIHILTISSLAIPGIVLGLSYVVTFSSTFLHNTFIILIIVNIIHFMASPYLMAYNALLKVNHNYEVVAKTCNISQFKIIKDVIVPCTKGTIFEMMAYFFVNSMVTISAIAFLFNTRTMPLSLLINNYEGNLMLGEAAIVSLIILFFNVIVKTVVYLINRKEDLKKRNEINI